MKIERDIRKTVFAKIDENLPNVGFGVASRKRKMKKGVILAMLLAFLLVLLLALIPLVLAARINQSQQTQNKDEGGLSDTFLNLPSSPSDRSHQDSSLWSLGGENVFFAFGAAGFYLLERSAESFLSKDDIDADTIADTSLWGNNPVGDDELLVFELPSTLFYSNMKNGNY